MVRTGIAPKPPPRPLQVKVRDTIGAKDHLRAPPVPPGRAAAPGDHWQFLTPRERPLFAPPGPQRSLRIRLGTSRALVSSATMTLKVRDGMGR